MDCVGAHLSARKCEIRLKSGTADTVDKSARDSGPEHFSVKFRGFPVNDRARDKEPRGSCKMQATLQTFGFETRHCVPSSLMVAAAVPGLAVPFRVGLRRGCAAVSRIELPAG